VAVVTWASRGIGRAVALELAGLGASVIVTARTDVLRTDIAGTIGETAAAITSAGGRCTVVKADLLNTEDLARLVGEAHALSGRVDILVNNAAFIGDAVFQSSWEMEPVAWRSTMEVNVNAAWVLMRAFAPAMRDHGSGLIVNLTSAAGLPHDTSQPSPLPGQGGLGAAYPTSKAALTQMTAFIGNELRPCGIAVIALDPGFARSESAEILASRIGADPEWAQPVTVASKAVGWLATSATALELAGRFVVARQLVEDHQLLGR